MKKLIVIAFLILHSILLLATQQRPDILYYQGAELSLSAGWGHPSPLETYYSQNNLNYPFTMLSTANYRGHIAVWSIEKEHLFLKEVRVKDEKFKPTTFDIKSQSNKASTDNRVLADWFSGIIIGEKRREENNWNVETTFYFHVRHGKIIDQQELSESDFTKLVDTAAVDTSDHEFMAKRAMFNMNYDYIAYYFRSSGKDTITLDHQGGYLSGKNRLSPVLSYFDNDPLKWPYNWENEEKNGAPYCSWTIENDSLFLTQTELHTGTNFTAIDKRTLELAELFPKKTDKNKVFGDWVSGIYIVSFGETVEDELLAGYFQFKASTYTYLRIKAGVVLEQYTVPANFDTEDPPATTEEGLKQLLKELR